MLDCEPSLGDKNPKRGLALQKVSMYDYKPSLADCCAVLGTTGYIQGNTDAWLNTKQGSNNGNAPNNIRPLS
jgi:hypothetical protein